MPTTWTRTPEEFHKIYAANTDAFYRLGGSSMAKELDEFVTKCALSLWSRCGGLSEKHVAMANEIGLRCIAEGVETEDQLEIMRIYGCRYVQGYVFDKPMPVEEFEKRLMIGAY